MGDRHWQRGVGSYVVDRSIYVVVDDEGEYFLQFAIGQKINKTTYVVQRGQDLVIVRDGQDGVTSDILVLVDKQRGLWRPRSPFFRPETIRNEVSTTDEPAAQPAPVNQDASLGGVLAAAQAVLDRHNVFVGPGDSLLLAQYGRFRTPFEVDRLFKGQLATGAEFRRDIIALACGRAMPWNCDEVPLKFFNPKATVECPPVLGSPKWVLVCGEQRTPILPKESAVRFNVADHKRDGAPMAANGSTYRDWAGVLGTLRVQQENVYPAGEHTVLVQCTPCSSRAFITLVATQQGPTLVQYGIERDIKGRVMVGNMRQQSEPHYILAYDSGGRTRCFHLPA